MSHSSNTDLRILIGSSLIVWLTALVSECVLALSSTLLVSLHVRSYTYLFVGESNGYNIPEVRACPEVGQYLHMSLAQLANQVPREMEGVAKRLFCDGYMYLYQSKSMSLYR